MSQHRLHRRRVLSLALLGTLVAGLAPAASAAAAEPREILSAQAIRYNSTATATLPSPPSGATAVTLEVSGEYAWRPTALSVCAGTSVTSTCKDRVALQLPVQSEASTTVTVPLPSGSKAVTVYNSAASARVTLAVLGYATSGTTTAVAPATSTSTSTGFAGPDTTGVPAGTSLKVHYGDLYISQPGQVVSGLDVRGLVRVKADNVVIKNSIIRGRSLSGSMGLITNDLGAHSFTVENSELIPSDASPHINGIIGHNFTVRRTEIARVIDSLHITGSNVRVEDSWLHSNLFYAKDPSRGGGPSHADSVQIQGGSNHRFLRNRIDGAYSSAFQTTQDRSAIRDVVIEGNRINGGGCSINIAWGSRYSPIPGSALQIRNNTFGLNTRHSRCAVIAPSSTGATLVSNKFTDGDSVSLSRGW